MLLSVGKRVSHPEFNFAGLQVNNLNSQSCHRGLAREAGRFSNGSNSRGATLSNRSGKSLSAGDLAGPCAGKQRAGPRLLRATGSVMRENQKSSIQLD
jgi:hypothetical protein